MGIAVLKSRGSAAGQGRPAVGDTLPWCDTGAPGAAAAPQPAPRGRVASLAVVGVAAAGAGLWAAFRLATAVWNSSNGSVPRGPLLEGLVAAAACLGLLALLALAQWHARQLASRTLRATANELRRGAWESAVAGLRQPARAVPSAFGDLANQVEGVISESDRRWRARAELSSDWYWEMDARFKLSNLSADAPIVKPAGRALGDVLGRRCDELGFCDPPAIGWDAFHDVLERQESFRDLELAVRGLGGRPHGWIALSGRPRMHRDGTFAGYEGVARDVSAAKEAYRRLQASEQRYAVMAGLSADWYWSTDEHHRIPTPDAEMVRRFGQMAVRNAGKTRWEAFADALSPTQWAVHQEELRSLQPFRALEFAVQRDDGRTIWISLAGAPRFDERGQFIGYHGVGRDITLRKMHEQMLVQHNRELQSAVASRTRELELANRDLDAFARQLAHELRTPIGHVQGLAELLRQRLGARLQPEEAQMLTLQSNAAHDMLATLEALLELARSSTATIERQAIDLSALVHELIAALPLAVRQAPVQWEVQPEMHVYASAPQLRIVLQNLLSNAAKFTRDVSQPIVSVSGQHNADGQLLIRVADNGAGFEPSLAARLFQPFQRLHRDTEFHGTGIGLTIVQRIVQRHGGAITARGTPGVGAVFEFTLGQREAGESEPVQPTPRGEAPHPLPAVG